MWNPDPFVANRPLKVVPIGHKKPKFFAQMSSSRNERPHLDFNKMQHSKRLIMVSFGLASCVGYSEPGLRCSWNAILISMLTCRIKVVGA